MKITIKSLVISATLLPVFALTLAGCCTRPGATVQAERKPGLIQADIPVRIIQEPVTVDTVDVGRRIITLKHANGTTKTFNVDANVPNLDRFKPGETVKATVKAEMSVYLLQNGRLPNADGTTRPKTINFNSQVLAIDLKHRLLTLQFSKAQTMTIKASPEVLLEKMAPGDDVVIRSNEIIAITLKNS